MTPELTQLRNELAKSNNHETGFLRGCIADLIRNKTDRNLLNICVNSGVLQDFFQDASHDTFFIARCKTKLVEEFFMNDSAVEKVLGYCRIIAEKKSSIEVVPSSSNKTFQVTIPIKERESYWDKNLLLRVINVNDDANFLDIEPKETSDGREYFILHFADPNDKKVCYSLPISGSEDNETFEIWECTSNCDFKSNGCIIKKGTKEIKCYSVE